MELKQFIKEALLNIVDGIEEANAIHKRFKIIGIQRHATGKDGNYVDFDVSVIVDKKSGGKAKGKVGTNLLQVVSANLDASLNESQSHLSTQRLKFKVWVSEQASES